MKKTIIFAVFFSLCVFSFLAAQVVDSLESWMDLIEDDPTVAEILQDLRQNPVAVNQADKQEWLKIPLLSANLVNRILAARNAQGKFTSIRQIRQIVGAEIYRRIRPFLILNREKPSRWRWIQRNYRTIETPEEIQDDSYLGSNLYNYSKMTLHYNRRISAGLIFQKDIGEQNFNDYLSGFVQMKTENFKIIAGSFYAHLGQGLVFSSPFGRIKSSMVLLPFFARKDGASVYIGSGENLAQTGLMIRFRFKRNDEIRIMASRTLRDGQFNPNTLQITDFDYSGYHRTLKEKNQKDLICERVLGINFVHLWTPYFKAGFTAARIGYEPTIHFDQFNVPFSERRRRYFHFAGRRMTIGSVYYDWQKNRFRLSGEFALSGRKAQALSQSVLFNVKPVQFGLLFWHVDNRFQSPYGRIFGNRAPFPRGEQGVYGAIRWEFGGGNIRFYKTIKRKLWRSYFSPMPVLNDDWFGQAEGRFTQFAISVRLRRRYFETFISQDNGPAIRKQQQKTNVRLEWSFFAQRFLTFRSRAEFCRLTNPAENGFLVFQDVRFRRLKHLQLNMRISFFRTHSFNTGIYEYESDVPGSFSNYALYGQGFKWYVRLSWMVNRHFKFWLKYRYLMRNKLNFGEIDYGRIEQPLQRLIRVQTQVTF